MLAVSRPSLRLVTKVRSPQPLWELTRDLHHACEAHPIGASMSNATVSEQVWCDWLGALHIIHRAIDPWLPPYVQVSGELTLDLMDLLPLVPAELESPRKFISTLTSPERVCGAAYVLIGAHRRGGRVIEKNMTEAGRSLPSRHIRFFMPDESEAFVKFLRHKGQLAEAARNTFQCLLDTMDEIRG